MDARNAFQWFLEQHDYDKQLLATVEQRLKDAASGRKKLLLDAGEDASHYNPGGFHAHSTPLHQAAFAGHFNVVPMLVERVRASTSKTFITMARPRIGLR
jgi:hypothetical protein